MGALDMDTPWVTLFKDPRFGERTRRAARHRMRGPLVLSHAAGRYADKLIAQLRAGEAPTGGPNLSSGLNREQAQAVEAIVRELAAQQLENYERAVAAAAEVRGLLATAAPRHSALTEQFS